MTTPVAVFEFRTHTDVTLSHVNFRKELHGEDHVQACDLNVALDVPNTLLDKIAPGLRQALYCNLSAEQGQDNIEGVDSILPNLRFPRLNGGKFALDDKKNKLAGYELEIEYGLGDERSNMLFDCCKIVKRQIETKEGGTVRLSWQMQYSGDRLDRETIGKLALLEQDEITIRLFPPAVQVVEDGDDDEEELDNPFPVDNETLPLTAEDVFVNGSAAVH